MKEIYRRITFYARVIDEKIFGIYNNLTHNMDNAVSKTINNKHIKKLLKAKQITFLFFLFYNFTIFSTITINENEIYSLIKKLIHLLFYILHMTLISLLLYFHTKKYDKMILIKNDDLDKYISTHQPEYSNKCEVCKTFKCIRSMHCYSCGKCILRYEFHSEWFNTCIGAQNLYTYIYLLKNLLSIFIVLIIGLILAILDGQSIFYTRKRIFFMIPFMLVQVYMLIKLKNFTRLIICNANENLTFYERNYWSKLPYMWKNTSKEFFNPFDKGEIVNRQEVYMAYSNPDYISLEERNDNPNETESGVSDNTDKSVNKEESFIISMCFLFRTLSY
jgi:hypothetical protein